MNQETQRYLDQLARFERDGTRPEQALFTGVLSEGLLADPRATREFIIRRVTEKFESRAALAKHTADFAARVGLTPVQVTGFVSRIRAQPLRLSATQARERRALAVRERARTQLDAVIQYIVAAGSGYEIAEEYNMNSRTFYKAVRRMLAVEGIEPLDLQKYPMSARHALAYKIERRERAIIEEAAAQIDPRGLEPDARTVRPRKRDVARLRAKGLEAKKGYQHGRPEE